jgi:hypothetical protein
VQFSITVRHSSFLMVATPLLRSRGRRRLCRTTDSLEVSCSPFSVAQQIAGGANMVAFNASLEGAVALRTGAAGGRRQIAWFDRSGKEISKLGDSGFLLDPSLSRDGKYIAVRRQVEAANSIWVLDSKEGAFTQFTSDQVDGGGSFPTSSPEGAESFSVPIRARA